jgi:glycerol uptake facilitator-like aquaporin
MPSLRKRAFSEWLGTAFLLAAVVGSGIMAAKLADGNGAIALLCNTLPTGAILAVLILVFGPLSGAHFNPAVSLGFALRRELAWPIAAVYIGAQLFGAIIGVAARAAAAQGKMRRTPSRQCLSRLIAIYQNSSTYLTRLQFSPATRPVLAGNSPGSNLFAAPTLAAYRVQAFNMVEKSFCASVRSFGLFGPSSDAK